MRLFLGLLIILLMPMNVKAEEATDPYQKHGMEIHEKIKAGWEHYRQRNLKESADHFSEVSGLIRMIRAKELDVLLPAAPQGWVKKEKTKDEYINESSAGSMFGGMSMISSTYTKGDEEVQVVITGESPMIEGLISLARLSPETAMEGKEKFKQGYLEFEESSYENQVSIMLLESASQVQIQGKGMTKETGMLFANLLDLESINASLKVKSE